MPFFDLSPAQLAAYTSSAAEPADFDAFWGETLDMARRVGGAAIFEPVETTLRLIDVFDVTFPGFEGHPVHGWLMLPRERTGPLPLVVEFVGYGGGRGFAHEKLHWAASGFAYFRMDTRGQGSGWSRGATADPVGTTPSQPGMMTKGILDPRDYYYRRVFTDGVRAIDALAGHEAIDTNRIAVVGGSQGGGISIAVGGLDRRVKAVLPDVPFLCDFPRAVGLTTRDPYSEIVRFRATHRDRAADVFHTLSYFDGVNFARRATAPALFSVASMDDVCPPSTVYGAFNAYAAADKSITVYAYNNHEGGGPFQDEAQMRWLRQRWPD